jgi:hypothetical protein
MTADKQRRIATAAGFLCGVLASLDALRDAAVLWPPEVVWQGLRAPQRFELGAGLALIVVTLLVAALRRREA